MDLEKKPWWSFLGYDLQRLLLTSFLLIDKFKKEREKLADYSFIVFPAAKAYEGFLKKILFFIGFINKDMFESRHFRLGKALNPSLEKRIREKEGVYDRLKENYGEDVASILWDTWRTCRNTVFHWFPDNHELLSLEEAISKVENIVKTIDFSYSFLRR